MVKLKPQNYKIGNGGWNKDRKLRSNLFHLKLSVVLKNSDVMLVLCLTILASAHVLGSWIDFLGDRLWEQNLTILLHVLCLE